MLDGNLVFFPDTSGHTINGPVYKLQKWENSAAIHNVWERQILSKNNLEIVKNDFQNVCFILKTVKTLISWILNHC